MVKKKRENAWKTMGNWGKHGNKRRNGSFIEADFVPSSAVRGGTFVALGVKAGGT